MTLNGHYDIQDRQKDCKDANRSPIPAASEEGPSKRQVNLRQCRRSNDIVSHSQYVRLEGIRVSADLKSIGNVMAGSTEHRSGPEILR